jgi:AAA15 family ATPase/GTPase
LKINNFRGFDSLEIDGLSKINLFVGKNNSGKTSILEALFLLSGMVYTDLPSVINSFRGFDSETESLKYLFYNLSYQNKPSIYGKFSDNKERRLELEAIAQKRKDIRAISTPKINGIKFLFSQKNSSQKEAETFSLVFDNSETNLDFETPGSASEMFNAIFIPANRNDIGVFSRLSEMIIKKEESAIVKTLQDAFGDRILRTSIVGDDVYFDIKDIGTLIPIKIMGEGIRRFLSIVTSVSGKQLAFACIDEIENGLHYSAHKRLWKELLSVVLQSDIQLFITTHNIEVVSSLKTVLEKDFTSMQDDVVVFDLAKTKKAGYMAYRYSYKGFRGALENEIEIRD